MTAKITKLWRGVKVVEQLPLTDVGLVFNDQSNKLAHSPHVNLLQGLIPLSGHHECVCSYLSGVSVSCLPVHWLCLCLTCHRVCLARQILGVCVFDVFFGFSCFDDFISISFLLIDPMVFSY